MLQIYEKVVGSDWSFLVLFAKGRFFQKNRCRFICIGAFD